MFIEYGTTGRGRPFGPRQARTIFKEMVLATLRNGRLSTHRRRNLVKFAAALRLSAVDAGEVIQEARTEFDAADCPTKPTLTFHATESRPTGSCWPTVGIFTAVAVLILANVFL